MDFAESAERSKLIQLVRDKDAEIARVREIAQQLETALSEYLADLEWKPKRSHIERARNDIARMAKPLKSDAA